MKTFLNNITLKEFISLFDGEIYANKADMEAKLSYICTDSREAEEGAVFVALVGERTDGHKYMGVATDKGAVLVICERLPEEMSERCAYAVTKNSEKALLHAANEYRRRFCPSLRAVAVTGSVGKTTAKEIIYASLSEKLDVYKTDGNFNSVIGMPISLLGMKNSYEYAVYEMGMSALGEINSMSTALMPHIGVITNVGHSHLEYLKTRENILKAKLEITDGISPDGFLVINWDDEMLSGVDYSKYPFKTVKCSQKDESADYYAYNVRFSERNSMLFDFTHGGVTYRDAEISGVGSHLVTTALCAVAVGNILGLSDGECVAGFGKYKNASMRQNIVELAGLTVIEDCYNAAPESMRAALDALSRLKNKSGSAKTLALLGDMKELGEGSDALHEGVGEYAARSGVDILITFGELAKNMSGGALKGGMEESSIYHFDDLGDMNKVGQLITKLTKKGDILLVKASRSMMGERAVEYLRALDAEQ